MVIINFLRATRNTEIEVGMGIVLFLIISIFAGSHAKADENISDVYFIQIGALKKMVSNYEKEALNYGQLKIVKGPQGLYRYLIGPFETKGMADGKAEGLDSIGYAGSFVSTINGVEETVRDTRNDDGFSRLCEGQLLAKLPEHARSHLVYVKDELHVRQDDQLLSVREFLKRANAFRKIEKGN